MRTDATWRRWLPIELLALPAAELPLAVLPGVEPLAPLAAVPGWVGVSVEPALEPVTPVPVEPGFVDDAEASEPVTSTWCPLCCASSVSRPCRM